MTIPFDNRQFVMAMTAVQEFASPDREVLEGFSQQRRKRLLREIDHLRNYLATFEQHVERIKIPDYTFDLSNPVTVGEMIVYKLEQEEKRPLNSLTRFFGAGVYMLYYDGPFEAYQAIKTTNCPIYVGSASPKDKIADTPRKQKLALYDRLIQHLNRSLIHARSTLDPDHFLCRFLVVQSGLELAAEQFLMRRYHPVWNKEEKVCPGFGKHGDQPDPTAAAGGTPESGRKEKSKWDILHPGRPWASRQSSRRKVTPNSVKEAIQRHFIKLLDEDRQKWQEIFAAEWVARQPSSPP